jgi:hypothetical protein
MASELLQRPFGVGMVFAPHKSTSFGSLSGSQRRRFAYFFGGVEGLRGRPYGRGGGFGFFGRGFRSERPCC